MHPIDHSSIGVAVVRFYVIFKEPDILQISKDIQLHSITFLRPSVYLIRLTQPEGGCLIRLTQPEGGCFLFLLTSLVVHGPIVEGCHG